MEGDPLSCPVVRYSKGAVVEGDLVSCHVVRES